MLKSRFALEYHAFPGGRVGEFEPAGVQKQAPGFVSVQFVACYRSIETVVMGAMYTQLVCASCLGMQFEKCSSVFCCHRTPCCYCLSAFRLVYNLHRTVERVGA